MMFPESGITKAEGFAYYEKIADRLLPFLQDRMPGRPSRNVVAGSVLARGIIVGSSQFESRLPNRQRINRHDPTTTSEAESNMASHMTCDPK
jgi:hypothetical protein